MLTHEFIYSLITDDKLCTLLISATTKKNTCTTLRVPKICFHDKIIKMCVCVCVFTVISPDVTFSV